MATKGSHIDFMFLGPPYPAAGSATDIWPLWQLYTVIGGTCYRKTDGFQDEISLVTKK